MNSAYDSDNLRAELRSSSKEYELEVMDDFGKVVIRSLNGLRMIRSKFNNVDVYLTRSGHLVIHQRMTYTCWALDHVQELEGLIDPGELASILYRMGLGPGTPIDLGDAPVVFPVDD